MKRSLAVTSILAAILLLTPLGAQAQSKATFFGPIVPEECNCKNQTVEGTSEAINTAPDYGCVLQVLQNVINFAVSLSIILLTLYLVIAAFGLLTSGGRPDALTAAKTRILNVVIGLAVLLTSWLIIDFVMKSLYDPTTTRGTVSFGPWNGILAADSSGKDRCIVARVPDALTTGIVEIAFGPTAPGGAVAGGGVPGVTSGVVYSDAQTRSAFKAGGIVIAPTTANRTLANTRADTVNQVLAIKKACGCTVQVNATTGGGHESGPLSHATGYKVDLQINAGLDAFLKDLRRDGQRDASTPYYYDRCGNQYAREPSAKAGHWDIRVDKGVCPL